MFDKLSSPTTCLFLQATRPVCRYVVVRESANRPVLITAGSFEHDAPESLVEHCREELGKKKITVTRAVLLLPRGDVEVNSLELPPATEDELPELVANVLAQQIDDGGEPIVHDFVGSSNATQSQTDTATEPSDTHDVLTFTVAESSLNVWKQRFKEQNLKLQSITFGGIGAVHLLEQISTKPARTSIVVTTTDQDTDLAVVEDGRPMLFRTIPRATGGEQFVVDQLAGDIQRTLTLVGHPDDEETRVYLIGSVSEQEDAAKILADNLGLSVSLVNPFEQLDGKADVDKPSRFANLIGMAAVWNNNGIEVDLLNPRKPTPKPSPWGRIGFWGTVAGLLLAIGGYMLWEQGANQQADIDDKQVQFERLIKRAKKAQTKVKIVDALDAWRTSEVSWLDEIDLLTEKLPPASDVTIDSLTMASGGRGGRMDMSVEVSDPSVRLKMEESIADKRHTIRSKRVTDASNRATSAWRFQTVVTVAAEPVPLTLVAQPEDPIPSPTTDPATLETPNE